MDIRKLIKSLSHFLGPLFLIMSRIEWDYRYNRYRKKYAISSSFEFIGESVKLEGDGEIILGSHSHIVRGSWLSSFCGNKIIVVNYCRIAQNVVMITSNTKADQDFSKTMDRSSGDIVLGDYVWVGCNVYIKEGVTIGNNSVIGANSVVTKDVPGNCKVLGTAIIRKNIK